MTDDIRPEPDLGLLAAYALAHDPAEEGEQRAEETVVDTTAESAVPYRHAGTTVIRNYNVYSQPRTTGPAWNAIEVDPVSVTLHSHGGPAIVTNTLVTQVTVRGKRLGGQTPVREGSGDSPISAPVGRAVDVHFFAGVSRKDPLPAWVEEFLEQEGLRYGA